MGEGQLIPVLHDVPAWQFGERRSLTIYGIEVHVRKLKCDDNVSACFALWAYRLDGQELTSETYSEGYVSTSAAELAGMVVLSQLADGTAKLVEVRADA